MKLKGRHEECGVTGCPEADELRDLVSKNRGVWPTNWLVVAHRLANHPDMPLAWKELRKRGGTAREMFSAVREVFLYANREVRRPSATVERDEFDRVKIAARELQRAIKESSLPADKGNLAELECDGWKSIPVVIGWRDLQPDGYGLGYPISVLDLLDRVVAMVDRELESRPLRSISRRRKRGLESAFVRRMTFSMTTRFGAEMHATVARITSAALDLSNPLDKKDVEAILKDCPPEFRPKHRKESNTAA